MQYLYDLFVVLHKRTKQGMNSQEVHRYHELKQLTKMMELPSVDPVSGGKRGFISWRPTSWFKERRKFFVTISPLILNASVHFPLQPIPTYVASHSSVSYQIKLLTTMELKDIAFTTQKCVCLDHL